MSTTPTQFSSSSCFSSSQNIVFNYVYSLSQTPHKLRKRMLATWTPDEELNQVRLRSGSDMKRKLKWHDLIALGVGGMLGAGVFVTTGQVAHKVSGPAVFISYIIAGVSALLSSLCYTEFSVNIPVAGGAFSYLRVTFGEFVGYFAGLNILMEYVLSNAAVARSFTEYLCRTVGVDPDSWRVEVDGLTEGYNKLDFPAVALILVLTLCLCHSTKESSILNLIMTVFHVIFFCLIVIAGFYNGSAKNLIKPKGLTPFGVKGVLDGSAIVYFSYIGYDSVSTTAEEIKNPSKSLPIGIIGSVAIVSVLYCLMALALCVLVPYNEISDTASFAFAFEKMAGWKWAGNIVGAGACLGIVASLLVAMLGQARYLCVIGRARLVPVWLAKVHPSTGTPMNATVFLGVCTATISLFTELRIVLEMVSIGTLLVFYLVANALVYRRYVDTNNMSNSLSTLIFLLLLSSSAIGFSMSWKLREEWWSLALFGSASIMITTFFYYKVPSIYRPSIWSVPLMPWPAATSIFLNIFLMTSLNKRSFQRFGIWAGVIILFYIFYGVHSTYSEEERDQARVSSHYQVSPPSSSSIQQESKVDLQLV
ncbi:hypothetical protein MKW98_024801 [Papaver atlanticum]|uniref:Cationic amino acid transporter C-terminal domain-containing protein n=1 Tax=Papaver atlanticum TaxID=357466 RepID=A0AAD4T4P2_9MAGN|nr:hypothetical protein MKW98_024801 [Papaver atlanticum]